MMKHPPSTSNLASQLESKTTTNMADLKSKQSKNDESPPATSHGGNMWILALVALVTGLVTEPLWQMYQMHLSRESTTLGTPSQGSVDRELIADEDRIIPSSSAADTKEIIEDEESMQSEYSCSPDELNDFLHDFSVPGMHLVCIDSQTMTMYYRVHRSHIYTETLEVSEESDSAQWSDVRSALQDKLRLAFQHDLKQPWALFSPTGDRLKLGENSPVDASTNDLFALGMFLVLEGGQWIWPGVRKGFVRHIRLDDARNATLETLSVHPLVFSVDGFLADEECDWIRQTAEPHMAQSGVSLMDRDKGKPATEWRTSETTFLNENTAEINEIDRRTSLLVRIPQNHQEPPQVLRYVLNARYDQHTDYFNPALYANDKRTMRMIANGRKNRMATVLWYLSDVAEGGETTFPQIDNGPPVSNQQYCNVGLQVKPEKGKVIIFYSLLADGQFDPLSLHGACPVKEGTKWAANKWVWNEPWSL